MVTDYHHPLRIEIVKWMKSDLWIWRGTVCGALCEGVEPRTFPEQALSDAHRHVRAVNQCGVVVDVIEPKKKRRRRA